MIRKNNLTATLPGVSDQTVKLRTMRPIVLSNVEHVGEFSISVQQMQSTDLRTIGKFNLLPLLSLRANHKQAN